MVDTPIVDDQVRKEIGVAEHIDSRLARGARFLEYLDSQWLKIGDANMAFDWKEIHTLLEADMRRVNESMKRRRKSRVRPIKEEN